MVTDKQEKKINSPVSRVTLPNLVKDGNSRKVRNDEGERKCGIFLRQSCYYFLFAHIKLL